MDPVSNLVNKIVSGAVWPFLSFLFVVAIAFFIYGLVELIYAADNEEKQTKGKKHITWALLGMFVMFAVWGIITIIQNFVGFVSS